MRKLFGYGGRIFRTVFLGLLALVSASASEEFFEAARKGDVPTLKAHLDKGLDVNTKWRYDQTALFVTVSRGHVEAVKLLLDRGANVDVQDSFYKVSLLNAASGFGSKVPEEKSTAVITMLLQKGAKGKEALLPQAAAAGKKEVVKALLAAGEWKPEALTAGLAAANAAKQSEIVEMLTAAGAKAPVDVAVDPATLSRYAGTYKSPDGVEVLLSASGGKLQATMGGRQIAFRALDQRSFEPEAAVGSAKVIFQADGEKVNGFEYQAGGNVMKFIKVEAK